ncbi:DUF5673 domain-containing protein [uncultured Clostridium sp.]|uniref:DUF5673 domain-containing protein n=1 Tax=uncultured Clostridium sp. TaxID=59620 RepID=UPI0028EA82BC|nr:DUF5673 domain-containing protein [uncultured Clostridium sp.]
MNRFYIVLNIIMSYLLLIHLYKRVYAGKFIIQTRRKKISIFYVLLLVLWTYMTSGYILFYIKNKSTDINGILQGLTWIQICITNFLSRRSLGITENGVYSGEAKSSDFTKWSKIKSYKWISDNKIEFETLGRRNKTIERELEVDEEQKEEVNKLLNESINIDRGINKNINFKLVALTTLIGIVISIGYFNLIKISKPYMVKKIKLSQDEAIVILKKTWKPLADFDKESIKSREDFDKIFEETMSKSMIDDLYGILVDTNNSKDGQIKFKEKLRVPTIYNTKMSIEKAYIKTSKYEKENKQVDEVDELIIEELGRSEENKPLAHSKKKSFFIKNHNGDWILNDITGLQSIGSQ